MLLPSPTEIAAELSETSGNGQAVSGCIFNDTRAADVTACTMKQGMLIMIFKQR